MKTSKVASKERIERLHADDPKCTCAHRLCKKLTEPGPCKGECGCRRCQQDYADYGHG